MFKGKLNTWYTPLSTLRSFNTDVTLMSGLAGSNKLWCGHKLRQDHVHLPSHQFLSGRPLGLIMISWRLFSCQRFIWLDTLVLLRTTDVSLIALRRTRASSGNFGTCYLVKSSRREPSSLFWYHYFHVDRWTEKSLHIKTRHSCNYNGCNSYLRTRIVCRGAFRGWRQEGGAFALCLTFVPLEIHAVSMAR